MNRGFCEVEGKRVAVGREAGKGIEVKDYDVSIVRHSVMRVHLASTWESAVRVYQAGRSGLKSPIMIDDVVTNGVQERVKIRRDIRRKTG